MSEPYADIRASESAVRRICAGLYLLARQEALLGDLEASAKALRDERTLRREWDAMKVEP